MANNFAPCPGTIDLWYAPGGKGVRVDTHVYSGYTVPPHYDSMIAKLIVTAATREIAIKRMKRALGEFTIRGIEDCLARGYERAGYFEVDTGEQKSWTIQLTDNTGAAPRP